MKLSLKEVKEIFNALLVSEISREEAEKWAELHMDAFDKDELIFEPSTDEQLLWKAVIYLSGVAMRTAPDEYMEDIENIEKEFNSKWNK